MIRGLQSVSLSARLSTNQLLSSASSAHITTQREYHGDPGPSTVQRQKRFGVRPEGSSSSRVGPSRARSPVRQAEGRGRPDDRGRAMRPRSGFSDASNRNGRAGDSRQQSPRQTPLKRPGSFYNQKIKPEERPTGHQADAFETSGRVTAWIRAHPSPVKPKDLDSLMSMVMDSPKSKVNVVVWNQLLSLLGREHKMDRMWKAFNDMKKRGIVPSSRTYTVLINAYSGSVHLRDDTPFTPMAPPSEKSFQRIVGIYNQSQQHIAECIRRITETKAELKEGEGSEDGLTFKRGAAADVREDHPLLVRIRQDEEEISLGPTNAYLKYLGRYGLWSEIDKIHIAMEKSGPLSPDNVTYSILFSGLLNRMAQQNAKKFEAARGELPSIMSKIEFGDRVRSLWDEAVKSFYPPRLGVNYAEENLPRDRTIDESLASLALSAFFRARPSEERLALSLIPFLWNLPEAQAGLPAVAAPASANPPSPSAALSRPNRDIPPLMRNIPAIPLTVKAAGAITTMLNRAEKVNVAAHFAKVFLSDRNLRPHVDFSLVRSAIHALSHAGDAKMIESILNMYQPTTGRAGWPVYVWDNALTATRWAADFGLATSFFRRMTHIPYGVEDGLRPEDRKPYVWSAPNGRQTDITGKRFIQPDPVQPTAKTFSLLFKTAFGSGNRAILDIRKAFNIYSVYPTDKLFVVSAEEAKIERPIDLLHDRTEDFKGHITPALMREAEWKIMLAKDLRRACDVMLEGGTEEEREVLGKTRDDMRRIVQTWGQLLDGEGRRPMDMRGPTIGRAGGGKGPASMSDAEEKEEE